MSWRLSSSVYLRWVFIVDGNKAYNPSYNGHVTHDNIECVMRCRSTLEPLLRG